MKPYKLPKNRRFKSKFTIKIDFEYKKNKKLRKKLIKEISKALNKKRVTIKQQNDYSIIIVTRIKSCYFPATTNSVKGDLIYHADTNQYNFTVETDNNMSTHNWERRCYRVCFEQRLTEESVAYIYANSEEEAKAQFKCGIYDDMETIDSYDYSDKEITMIEEGY